MNAPVLQTEAHQQTYHRIFQHPTLYNIEWREVIALLRDFCHVEEKPNGSLRFTRRGRSFVVRMPLTKEMGDINEINAVRDFLLQTEELAPGTGEPTDHWVLVIDHHQARLFNSDQQGTPALQVLPPQPTDHFRHTAVSTDFAHSLEPHGQSAFFEAVAQELKSAPNILVLGLGTGTGSCMQQFVDWVRLHHADLAERIIGTLVTNEHHLTEDQLLDLSRKFFKKHRVA